MTQAQVGWAFLIMGASYMAQTPIVGHVSEIIARNATLPHQLISQVCKKSLAEHIGRGKFALPQAHQLRNKLNWQERSDFPEVFSSPPTYFARLDVKRLCKQNPFSFSYFLPSFFKTLPRKILANNATLSHRNCDNCEQCLDFPYPEMLAANETKNIFILCIILLCMSILNIGERPRPPRHPQLLLPARQPRDGRGHHAHRAGVLRHLAHPVKGARIRSNIPRTLVSSPYYNLNYF